MLTAEIRKKLETQPIVKVEMNGKIYEYQRIHASQARDYDGRPCNYEKDDPRHPIQLKIYPKKKKKTIKQQVGYVNYW